MSQIQSDIGHITNASFGWPEPDKTIFWNAFLKIKNSDFITIRLLLDEIYDEVYGIFDHSNNPNRKLSLVAHHHAEDVHYESKRSKYMKKFILAEIGTHTGLSLNEFFNLSFLEIEEIIEICKELNRAKNISLSKADSEMKQASAEMKKILPH